jgi:hypothetical protein
MQITITDEQTRLILQRTVIVDVLEQLGVVA